MALPSNLEKPPQAIEAVNSTAPTASLTAPSPFQEYEVNCLQSRITTTLIPSDCSYVLNDLILTEPNVFRERRFRSHSDETDTGNYIPSQWQFDTCEVIVVGHPHANTLLTLYNVALTVIKIVLQCVGDETYHKGGLCLIGDASKGFHVIVRAFAEHRSISAKNSTISQRPAVGVSRRTIRSQHDSENATRGLTTKDPLPDVSRVSNRKVVISNSTLSVAAPPRYPVHCFNPFILHLQPAAAEDCGFIINQIILRLFDPTRQLTFGFTDAVDVNLSKPQYHQWQYGQCLISVKNNDEGQIDTFRLLDVANTARRITTKCLVDAQPKIGGVAFIGTDGRGFYVFIGSPLISNSVWSDAMLLRESTGVESS